MPINFTSRTKLKAFLNQRNQSFEHTFIDLGTSTNQIGKLKVKRHFTVYTHTLWFDNLYI